MNVQDKIQLGSETAQGGFRNEEDVVRRFNNWKSDLMAQEWLKSMGYSISEIELVEAMKVSGSYKADIQVQIQVTIKLKKEIDCQNLQVKLVSNLTGFNQIDKRWVRNYKELWGISDEVEKLLMYFSGELRPYKANTRDNRRMFVDEFSEEEQNILLNFFKENKTLILADILKGRGRFSAEWMLVVLKTADTKWALKPMNYVLNFYDGEVLISPRGSVHIGKITIQRKGGDNGRDTANMLQFKLNPALLVE